MLTKRSVLLAKEETTYGSDPTPTEGDNALLAIDAVIKEVNAAVERPVQQASLSTKPSVLGTQHVEVTFKIEVQGSGTAGTAPRLGCLLEACGFDETIVSGTSVTYEPVSSSHSSATLWLYKDGRKHVINGARGSVKATLEAGKIALLEFTMKGLYTAPTNVALPSATYESTTPPVCKSSAFTYDSKTTLVVGMVEIDVANTVAQRFSLSESTGVKGFEITGRKPVMTIDPEAQIQTSYTFRTDLLTNQRQISVVVGATAGNICTITVPKYNMTNIEYADKDGVLIEKITGECNENSGDDEIAIAFT